MTAAAGPPTILATARVSPTPSSSRQPAVSVRPSAFRPVGFRTATSSRTHTTRAASPAVRAAAPGLRQTVPSKTAERFVALTAFAGRSAAPTPQTIASGAGNVAATAAAHVTAPTTAHDIAPTDGRGTVPTATRNTALTTARAGATAPGADRDTAPAATGARAAVPAAARVSAPTAALNAATSVRRTSSPASHRLPTGPSMGIRLEANIFSPPPPRGSAQDAPATLSACPSRQGSDMSASSGGSCAGRRVVSPDTPARAK